jgi:hypothetical protein
VRPRRRTGKPWDAVLEDMNVDMGFSFHAWKVDRPS